MSILHYDRRAVIEVTPAISNGAAYADGDAIGGLMTFNAAAKTKGSGGWVTAANLFSKNASLSPVVDILIFNELVTAGIDNAAFSPSDAEILLMAGPIQFVATDWTSALGANRPAYKELSMPFICAAGKTAVYAQMVARSAVTFTATDQLVAQLGFFRD